MEGETLGRLSLRLDAVYCIALGVIVATTSSYVDAETGLPAVVLATIGLAVVTWGAGVWWLSSHRQLRASLRLVMIANLAATAGLVGAGVVAGTVVVAIGAWLLSIDVVAFALSQGIALRRTRTA